VLEFKSRAVSVTTSGSFRGYLVGVSRHIIGQYFTIKFYSLLSLIASLNTRHLACIGALTNHASVPLTGLTALNFVMSKNA